LEKVKKKKKKKKKKKNDEQYFKLLLLLGRRCPKPGNPLTGQARL